MQKSKFFLLCAGLIVILGASGCGGNSTAQEGTPPTSRDGAGSPAGGSPARDAPVKK